MARTGMARTGAARTGMARTGVASAGMACLGVVRTGMVVKMDMFGDQEMVKVAEVDPLTLEIREYTVEAEKVTSIINPFANQ